MQIQFYSNKPKVLVCTTSQTTLDNLKKNYGKTFRFILVRGIAPLRIHLAKELLPVIFDATSFGLNDTLDFMDEYDEKYGEIEPGKTFTLFLSDKQLHKYFTSEDFTKDENILNTIFDNDSLMSIANVNNLATYPTIEYISEIQDESQSLEEVFEIFPKTKELYDEKIKNDSVSLKEEIESHTLPNSQPVEALGELTTAQTSEVANSSNVLGDVPPLDFGAMIQAVSPSGDAPVLGNESTITEMLSKEDEFETKEAQNLTEEVQEKPSEDMVPLEEYNKQVNDYKDLEERSLKKLEQFQATNNELREDNEKLLKQVQDLSSGSNGLSITEFKQELAAHEQKMSNLKNSLNSNLAKQLEEAQAKANEDERLISSLANKNTELKAELDQVKEKADERVRKEVLKNVKLENQFSEFKQQTEEWVNTYKDLMMNAPFTKFSTPDDSTNKSFEQKPRKKEGTPLKANYQGNKGQKAANDPQQHQKDFIANPIK